VQQSLSFWNHSSIIRRKKDRKTERKIGGAALTIEEICCSNRGANRIHVISLVTNEHSIREIGESGKLEYF